MRQKVTWIIPGILVTLLLGLLWAMPAFAADAGNIEFLDGDDEIRYISLNGLGGPDEAIMIQVEDEDLNAPDTETVDVGAQANFDAIDWSNLADANDDGNLNYQDFKWFVVEAGNDTVDPAIPEKRHYADTSRRQLDLNVQAGTLAIVSGGVAAPDIGYTDRAGEAVTAEPAEMLEFEIFNREDISGRSATTEERNDPRTGLTPQTTGDASGADLDAPAEAIFADIKRPQRANETDAEYTTYLESAATGTWTWLDILDTNRDGQLNGDDAGISVYAADATNKRSTASEGTVGAAGIVAVNTGKDTNLVLEYTATGYVADNEDEDSMPQDIDGVAVTVFPVLTGVEDDADTTEIREDVSEAVDATVTLTYTVPIPAIGSDKNRVKLSTDAFPAGINVILTESAARSGKFQAMVEICDSSMDSCEAEQVDSTSDTPLTDGKGMVTIPANNQGDSLRVTYADASPSRNRSTSIPLDVDNPSFSNLAPDTGTSGREDEPTVSFDVQDTDSGISDDKDVGDSVYVLAGLYSIQGDSLSETIAYERDDLKLEEATNGYSASVSIEEGPSDLDADLAEAGSEYEIHWWAVSTDLAGNVGVSDSDSETKCTVPALDIGSPGPALTALDAGIVAAVKNDDGEVTTPGTGCDPFVVRVDAAAPELDETNTFTGTWLDGSTEKSGADAKRTSIVVAFSEALDCDSVSTDDFEVDGAAPNGATCKGSNVYLDVDELDPNDRPEIQVGNESLSDKAGNLIGDLDEITANDGIPAKLTVTVTGTAEGSRPITDEDITIMIQSDERLAGNPSIVITKVGEGNVLQADTTGTGQPTGAVNEWVYKPVFAGNDDDGLYNVRVTGNDLGSGALKLEASSGTKGAKVKDSDPAQYTHDPDSKSAILFEVDNEVQGPDWSPDIVDDGKTDNAGVFIRAEFADEGKEYGLAVDLGADNATGGEGDNADSNAGASTDDPGDVATDYDTSGTVTLISATFNGDDVTADVITRDWVLYVYRPGNLTNGEHEFTIEVMDAAGNEDEFTLEFEKVDRPAYKLEINPGPNLVSFPANPADGDVNAVFGGEGNEDISQVLTFDNASGLWSTATRGEDGMFIGDLTTVNGMNGYWVVADGIVDVSVVLEGQAGFQPPTHIQVQEGWNLIGVVDSDQNKAGTGIATSDYFANIDAEVVYGYNSLSGRLDRLSTAKAAEGEEQDMVETGKGYWVYANKAGIIVP